jgi:catechol 2,3-dioxygenase-like lactoylglutathione lyase family enzyme
MRMNSFYPVVLTDDVERSSAFFLQHLGFRETFRSDWYISLVHAEPPEYELAFVLASHESVPAAVRGQRTHVLLNFEVEDAAREADRLREAGMEIVLPLRDEAWGQRHFIGRAADGILLDVIEVITATAEYTASYTAHQSQ